MVKPLLDSSIMADVMPWWLVLLPLSCNYIYNGWCYCHGSWCYCYFFFVADVTTTVADVVATRYICAGWCYCHGVRCYNHPGWMCFFLADVKANCGWCYYHWSAFYFRFSSEMFNRTSSQMCGRWYLPLKLQSPTLWSLPPMTQWELQEHL